VQLENIFELDASATDDLAPNGACPFLGQEAWVSAVGRFDPCCAPDAQRRTLGEFGNINDQTFTEIWNGVKYRDLTRHLPQPCAVCRMQHAQASGCVMDWRRLPRSPPIEAITE
jgi:radical SAM protein with 4Fe4S-binding SPASM domain